MDLGSDNKSLFDYFPSSSTQARYSYSKAGIPPNSASPTSAEPVKANPAAVDSPANRAMILDRLRAMEAKYERLESQIETRRQELDRQMETRRQEFECQIETRRQQCERQVQEARHQAQKSRIQALEAQIKAQEARRQAATAIAKNLLLDKRLKVLTKNVAAHRATTEESARKANKRFRDTEDAVLDMDMEFELVWEDLDRLRAGKSRLHKKLRMFSYE